MILCPTLTSIQTQNIHTIYNNACVPMSTSVNKNSNPLMGASPPVAGTPKPLLIIKFSSPEYYGPHGTSEVTHKERTCTKDLPFIFRTTMNHEIRKKTGKEV